MFFSELIQIMRLLLSLARPSLQLVGQQKEGLKKLKQKLLH